MKYSAAIILLFLLLGYACVNDKSTDQEAGTAPSPVLRLNEPDLFRTLYPPASKDIVSSHIISQINDGLVKYDPQSLTIMPAIAKEWKIDPTGTVYTFILNDSVFFHNDLCFPGGTGRKVTASDFSYTFQVLCTKSDENINFFGTLDRVKGARDYYEASMNGQPAFDIEGIKVVDDYTLEITLESENPLFIYFLANPAAVVLPKEGIDKYGVDNKVGAGPFNFISFSENPAELVLAKNINYYQKDKDGRRLPYLDTLKFTFAGGTQKELKMFEDGKLDLVSGIPADYIPEFLDKHINEFEANPPLYVLAQSEEDTETEVYNLLHSYVQNFHTNRMNYMDFSVIYYEIPKKTELTETKE
ncbi:MAG: ABC transporter substrate-binding protein [Bacteroidota bacterium]